MNLVDIHGIWFGAPERSDWLSDTFEVICEVSKALQMCMQVLVICHPQPFLCQCPSKILRDMQNHLLLTTWDEPTRQQHFFSIKINQEGSPTLVTDLLKLPTPPSKNVERLYGALSINGFVGLYLSDTLFTIQTDHNHPVRIFKPCTRECIVFPHVHLRTAPSMLRTTLGSLPSRKSTSSWRRIEVDINDLRYDPLKCQFGRRTVFIHGAIHWMHDSTQNIIAVFDPEDERFRVIPFPKDYDYGIHGINDKQGNIFEMEGCLALIAMELVINMMREVEVQEKAVDIVQEEASRGGLDIMVKVELKRMLAHAKDANDMVVFCEM
ncbi:hypothetical protein C1H46_023566 [Malus baccata]|uniref:F-box associated domain-containing protein n=1 Tax=Malus baccata TaxID=106549 RepID=A0A540LWL9_MALBA|nr:hypothetical protein C1H46_023566 [Malus baccata]